MQEARERLAEHLAGLPERPPLLRQALGPGAWGNAAVAWCICVSRCGCGRCAGPAPAPPAPRLQPVALFGGGHVGHALARVLAPLPFAPHWIDSRDEVFPAQVDADTLCEHSDPVQAAVPELAPQSMVLIMSFSHAEDLDIVAACLARQRERADLPFIGLIGSRTKWATFSHRLLARGFSDQELAQVTCPIGVSMIITGKEPEVIAVAVAAQLLQRLDTN